MMSTLNFGASTSKTLDSAIKYSQVSLNMKDLIILSKSVIRYIFVVDTNILLRKLSWIKVILNTPIKSYGLSVLCIPWSVIQEIEKLKSKKENGELQKRIGEAVEFLNKILEMKNQQFYFQTPYEAELCKQKFSRSNGDLIIECCLKLQASIANGKIILLTQDLHLRNKSAIVGIRAISESSLSALLNVNLQTLDEQGWGSYKPVVAVLNHNWNVVNYLVACACDLYSIPHHFHYDRDFHSPTKVQLKHVLPTLKPLLDQLKEVMEKMLMTVNSAAPPSSVFQDLHKLLLDFVPSLDVEADYISYENFSVTLLERFCYSPKNRSQLDNGYTLLLTFLEKLDSLIDIMNETE